MRWFNYVRPDDRAAYNLSYKESERLGYDPPAFGPPKVWLRCACGFQSASVRTALQHHEDYHAPGLCSVRMLLDQTENWLSEYYAKTRQYSIPPGYSVPLMSYSSIVYGRTPERLRGITT